MVLAARLLTVARRHRPPLLSDFFPGQLDLDSDLSLLIFLPLEKVVSNEGVPKNKKNNKPFYYHIESSQNPTMFGASIFEE